jgi:hypothetical protein
VGSRPGTLADVVVAVVVLSLALACAVVALAALARSRATGDSSAQPRVKGSGAVVAAPPDPPAEPSQELGPGGPWQTLLEAADIAGVEQLLVRPWPAELDMPGGRTVPAGAPLARALQGLLARQRTSRESGPVAAANAAVFFRFEASPAMVDGLARGLYEVMPSAEGGFRSAIRVVAGKEIVGHGRYVATGGVKVGVRAAAEQAPKVARQLGFAAMTAALEIAADADQRRRLEAVREIATAVREDQIRERLATLEGAARRLDLAARSVLDTGFVPGALGVDSAAGVVCTAWERSARMLEEWHLRLVELPERVDLDQLEAALPGITDVDGGEFWRELAFYRASLALHTRATLLAAAEAAAHDPDHPYAAFRAGLELQLKELDAAGERLRVFARGLADREVTVGGPVVRSGTANQITALTRRLMRLAEELAHPRPVEDLPVAVGPGGALHLEGAVHQDGSVTLLDPDGDTPASQDQSRLRPHLRAGS